MVGVTRSSARQKLGESVGPSKLSLVDDEVVEFLACIFAEGTSLEHEIVDIAWMFLQQLCPEWSEEEARLKAREIRREFFPLSDAQLQSQAAAHAARPYKPGFSGFW